MRTISTILVFAAALTLGGVAHSASEDWRKDATRDDAQRLARLPQAWTQALAQARAAGFRKQLASLGPLADPAPGRVSAPPAPGNYRCRTFKLGSPAPDGLKYVAYGWFKCRVALSPGGDLTLEKTTGSQRTRGNLYPDTSRRLVYVGAQAWGDEGAAVYGRDAARDQIGVLERTGARQWRLVLPFPKQESLLDIMEIVPA